MCRVGRRLSHSGTTRYMPYDTEVVRHDVVDVEDTPPPNALPPRL